MTRHFLAIVILSVLLAGGNSITASVNHAGMQETSLQGFVLDQAHAPVAGAVVFLSASHLTLQTSTDNAGHFAFENVSAAEGAIRIEAHGFAPVTRELRRADFSTVLEFLLLPATVNEEVTITANRTETRLEDAAASVQLISATELANTSALAIDDALRQVPGFQLFRRSGSRTANPTSQGVSLRGVGASGASRALVIADGVPLNDPFGGWIYWGRIPRESLSRIEVLRGAASDLYGSAAMGGVVNLISRTAESPVLDLEASYGSQATPDGSLFTAARYGKWRVSLDASAFKTNGYIPVPADERGSVDTPANSEHAVASIKLDYARDENLQFLFGGSYFREARANGTRLQTNRTKIRQLTAGVDWQTSTVGNLRLRLYGGTQFFDQTFSAVAIDRNSENLTRVQRVPAQATGLSFQWSRSFKARHAVVAGIDAREVRGASDELAFVLNRATSVVNAGGRERDAGLFFKDTVSITPQLFLSGSARIDHWRNYDAHADTRPLAIGGTTTVQSFADRSETALSPQGSVLYKPNDSVSIFASAYKAFRAPTLNELYRSFRVGNILTLANEALRAEKLSGAEAGLAINGIARKLSLRGSFFWTDIDQPVANVTIAVTPNLITRARQNLGSTRSRGVEFEGNFKLARSWTASAGYLVVDAVVTDFPANTALEGLRIPQVPRQTFTFQLNYTNPAALNVGLQGRIVGLQFDDDLNLFPLPRYFALDALVSRRLNSRLEIFAAGENIFNQRYLIGRTPVSSIGPPVFLRVGFRVHLGS